MRRWVFLLCGLMLAGCASLEAWITEKATAAAEKKADAMIRGAAPESHATLDADKSGDVTFKEINSYGVPAAIALVVAELLRRRLKNKVGELHTRIDDIEAAKA